MWLTVTYRPDGCWRQYKAVKERWWVDSFTPKDLVLYNVHVTGFWCIPSNDNVNFAMSTQYRPTLSEVLGRVWFSWIYKKKLYDSKNVNTAIIFCGLWLFLLMVTFTADNEHKGRYTWEELEGIQLLMWSNVCLENGWSVIIDALVRLQLLYIVWIFVNLYQLRSLQLWAFVIHF